MRTIICGLTVLLSAMLVVVLSLFDSAGAQILGAALTLAAVMIGVGLFMDQASRRLSSRRAVAVRRASGPADRGTVL